MSLIERALGKARDGNKTSRGTPVVRRPVVGPTTQRLPALPQLQLTPEIQMRLGLSAPPEQQHQRASEYRHIKRKVLSDIGSAKNRIVLVASALAGEGKSFTSANLARSLAMEPDYSVLLVDA
ncbi:MAG: protein tyrosine kinase, partial [Proteobacteria bacterium]